MTPPQSSGSRAPLVVAGIMSGTSADGIDVALVRFSGSPASPKLDVLAHEGYPYPRAIRTAVLSAMNAGSISVAELSRLNVRLGMLYADAVERTIRKQPMPLHLVGCHGQTVYHQGSPAPYLGVRIACTWQTGEAAILAHRLKVPVVSDFRPADIAAGGQGAPLVPLLDYVLFRHPKRGRVLQNLGGISNLTAIPASACREDVIAFDSGPANMVIDALMQQLFHRPFDRNGATAAKGRALQSVLTRCLNAPYFSAPPPKSTGREQFGSEYASRFLSLSRNHSSKPEDAIATATALTATSIAQQYQRFLQPLLAGHPVDYILAGGGAHNTTLVSMLRDQLTPLGCTISDLSAFGMDPAAKEAIAFALLAHQTWHHLPGNIPSATGAQSPAILGKITYA